VGRSKRRASPSGRIAALAVMGVEPAVLVTLLMVIVAATFWAIGDAHYARTLVAILVPLELTIACWLLSMRLECRARAQHLLREQGETQIQRISTWLNMSLGASMLLIVVLGGLI